MTNLTPVSSLDDVVEHPTTEILLAGPGGPLNQQAQSLLNRTTFINNRVGNLIDELGNTTNPLLGSALVGRQPLQINDVAELRTTPGRFNGDRCYLNNYLAGDGKGARGGTWVTGASTDNGGTHFAATGGTWVMDLDTDGMIDASFWGLPLASGFNNVEFAAIEAYMYANKVSCKIGPGIYDNGSTKYPWRTGDVAAAAFRDYGSASLYCTPQTVLRTTSANGNDVLNLVCVENFYVFGFPQFKSTITTELVSGSNGVSVVHGGRNIYIEATCEDLPYIDKGAGSVDGGSTTSLQANATSLLPFENIRFRVRAKGVSHGFTVSGTYEYFVDYPTKGCVLDIDVEDAYRGAAIGLAAPVEAPATPLHLGITGSVRCKNVQQPLFDARGDGVHLDVSVMNDLVKESLIFLPSNPLVAVVQILGAKNFNYNVHGEIRSADTWLRIGGTSMGGFVIGTTEKGVLHQNVKYNSVTTTVDLVSSSSVDIVNNELHLTGISSGYSGVSARSSTLFVNGQYVPSTIYPGDAAASLQQNSFTQVVFAAPLTATRLVTLPASGNIGDTVLVIRQGSATGASAVQVLGVNYAVSTWAEFVYNGSAWSRSKTGTT